MSIQTYALVDSTHTIVEEIDQIDSAFIAALVAASNPKANYYVPVNMASPAQPGFNPATQAVIQTGWTITYPTSVNPVWAVVTLTAAQQAAIADATDWTNTIALNLNTAFQTYISVAVPSQAQTNAVVLQLVKAVKALLQDRFGVTS